ncbi:MAG: DNA polymerase ligase N-terminal domain-containing protein [Methanoregula sp.]|nr:DNA polymerase ligase N-terminal domain-containing protein [Methanoregula sp.]
MSGEPQLRFVLHEHFARHHHFDLRLEKDGVLKSWAVPKGLPEKTGERRLAIAVEDHPSDYISFTGTIPEGQYGAGDVTIKDTGTYELLSWTVERIEVLLHGQVFSGKYVLIRFKKAGDNEWLVLRAKDT